MEEEKKGDVFQRLYDALEAKLVSIFGDSFDIYKEPPQNKEIPAPACIIECYEIGRGMSDGAGEVDVVTRWSIKTIMKADTLKERIKSRSVHAAIGAAIQDVALVDDAMCVEYLGSHEENSIYIVDSEFWVTNFEIPIKIGQEIEWEL